MRLKFTCKWDWIENLKTKFIVKEQSSYCNNQRNFPNHNLWNLISSYVRNCLSQLFIVLTRYVVWINSISLLNLWHATGFTQYIFTIAHTLYKTLVSVEVKNRMTNWTHNDYFIRLTKFCFLYFHYSLRDVRSFKQKP